MDILSLSGRTDIDMKRDMKKPLRAYDVTATFPGMNATTTVLEGI